MSQCRSCELVGMGKGVTSLCYDCQDKRIAELEEDLRIANHNLDMVEKWQDKVTEVYPVVAEHITRALYVTPLEAGDE